MQTVHISAWHSVCFSSTHWLLFVMQIPVTPRDSPHAWRTPEEPCCCSVVLWLFLLTTPSTHSCGNGWRLAHGRSTAQLTPATHGAGKSRLHPQGREKVPREWALLQHMPQAVLPHPHLSPVLDTGSLQPVLPSVDPYPAMSSTEGLRNVLCQGLKRVQKSQ